MPAKPAPSFSPASLGAQPRANTVEFDFTFRLITPMFGGGVEINGPQKPHDRITPIRIPSIRGQLRFWWRACNPTKATTAEELFEAEEAIWGSTKQPSMVHIAVVGPQPTPEPIDVFFQPAGKTGWRVNREHEALAYGLFPLQPPKDAKQQRPGVLWRIDEALTLRFQLPEDLRHSVHEALAAWTLFGGIGGRTRRGFGAVEFVHSSSPEVVPQSAKELLDWLLARPKIERIPSLAGATSKTRGAPQAEAEAAWRDALYPLQQFRQGLGLARNGNDPRHPGRSRWPEADELRRLARTHLHRHPPEHRVRKFPRAAFGLPIVFHFKDNPPEPSDMTLVPALDGSKRFASPLILRPQHRPDKSYEAFALVLANTRAPNQLQLDGLPGESPSVTGSLSPQEARDIIPLQRHGNANPDVLEAFLHYFESASPAPQPPRNRR